MQSYWVGTWDERIELLLNATIVTAESEDLAARAWLRRFAKRDLGWTTVADVFVGAKHVASFEHMVTSVETVTQIEKKIAGGA